MRARGLHEEYNLEDGWKPHSNRRYTQQLSSWRTSQVICSKIPDYGFVSDNSEHST